MRTQCFPFSLSVFAFKIHVVCTYTHIPLSKIMANPPKRCTNFLPEEIEVLISELTAREDVITSHYIAAIINKQCGELRKTKLF